MSCCCKASSVSFSRLAVLVSAATVKGPPEEPHDEVGADEEAEQGHTPHNHVWIAGVHEKVGPNHILGQPVRVANDRDMFCKASPDARIGGNP
mmetsp:Transcript_11441/g.17244  ORF Transcript_11441/g.17244 Transcript_11441/m.17244 type:complete len:93 (-) Transcript_11441:662-940(-)|eukprot:CAMPEP_0194756230 /NCGR_PEP_ID=MMETSP0323_2-20130528/9965_1 /TAXON_ID=2866 ORGANISM="Crypthecodinium cohnii, Strain Seligo" /NCGR_SAMPLE_ID=MMETSP0323_2 /ASSEMBLY_ACC=CAM_ASM_000346 /LENGTH=92 /DNA_ID=CAMNT_0039675639 /DNA_START=105 /DNA_END=383 /DNA_ORIENTATION=-